MNEHPSLATLSDQGHANNFNLIRLAAALAVLLSHSFFLTGAATVEPLAALLGDITIGRVAVDIFFLTSGFLVAKSMLTRQSLLQFIAARCLRIYPGLIVMTVLTIAVAGLFAPPGFFADPRTLRYGLATGLLWLPTLRVFDLPGVFASNPFPNAVNGSLWTLPFELRMYALLAMLWVGAAVAKASRARLTKLAIVAVALAAAAAKIARPDSPMAALTFMFFTGASYYVLRRHVKLNGRVAWLFTIAILASMASRPVFLVVYNVLVGYVLFTLAYLPSLWKPREDYSYGTYIYAFPIEQCIAHVIPGITWVPMTVAATPVVLAVAALSWHVVEKPALAIKRFFGASASGVPALNVAGLPAAAPGQDTRRGH